MQEKTVVISGKDVRFRSSAAIPRLYRIKFKRDIFKDLSKLEASYKGKSDDGEELQIEDLEIFENVAYIMAFHADPTIPGTIEEWLDEFEMFSIYQVLPEILELWGANLVTDIESKKNMTDLDLLTIGMVLDIWTEKGNDDYKYGEKDTVRVAGQQDFDNF